MSFKSELFKVKNKILALFDKRFECPFCGYKGAFNGIAVSTGFRKTAQCPKCQSFERHRLQFLVAKKTFSDRDTANLSILHFAPESLLKMFFLDRFGHYESADLNMSGVDHTVDLQQLPFKDNSYDVVYASHVLEHIPDDMRALSEIRRILRPNGMAILPVPMIVNKTVEYTAPNPNEECHVRAPGIDYYEKYRSFFSRINIFKSDEFPEKYQTYIYEDRSLWPTQDCPQRTPMQGRKHFDFVPVCYVGAK